MSDLMMSAQVRCTAIITIIIIIIVIVIIIIIIINIVVPNLAQALRL